MHSLSENGKRDVAHLIHGFTDLTGHSQSGPSIVTGGKGVYVYDEQGREYIEAVSGMWCTSLGFGEEELIEAATEQMRKLPYYHTLASKSVNPAIDLAEKLAGLAPIDNPKVYLALSGSEVNDFLIKFLWFYNNAIGRPQKKKVIARTNAYHGATVVASSLTGIDHNHRGFDVPLPGFLHTHDPHYFRDALPGETESQFGDRIVGDLEQLIQREGPDTVMAFIAEPVTGGGGVVIPPPGYYNKVREVLDRYDIFFLADEVITGIGRTGNWFGCQTLDVRPDAMTVAKGLSSAYQPIAAIVLSDEIHQGLLAGSNDVGSFAHGATYSGHPVGAAVALKVLEIIEKRNIIDHVREVGRHFERRLRGFEDHPLVGEVRCIGLMGAIEFVADKETKQPFDSPGSFSRPLSRLAEEKGVIARAIPVGDAIGFCPPLIITDAEIDELFDRFTASLDASMAFVGASAK